VPAGDSKCGAGQWEYIEALEDCSGAPVVVQDASYTGGRMCAPSSNGDTFWPAPGCISSLHVIAQVYYCQ
jgi:hypothetical protein